MAIRRKHNVSLEYWLELNERYYHKRGLLTLGETMDYEYLLAYIQRRAEGPRNKGKSVKLHEAVYPVGHRAGD